MVCSFPEKICRNPLAICLGIVVAGSLSASLALASAAQDSSRTAGPVDDFHTRVNDTLDLFSSELIQLDLANIALGQPFSVTLPVNGEQVTFDLEPSSVRAPDYRLTVQLEDGSYVDVEPGPVSTLLGWSAQMPGATVSASLTDEGLRGSILLADGSKVSFEPVPPTVAGTEPGDHVVYNSMDVIPHGGTCGMLDEWLPDVVPMDGEAGGGGAGGGICKLAQIAADADFPYFQVLGGSVTNVENRIHLIVNTINNQYESQVGIRHVITQIVVRTSAGTNPYSSNNAGTLLNQFRNVWATPPENTIKRDIAHLFTGQELQGSTIGVAWPATVCDFPSGNGYALSQHLTNFGCMTDLTAHEVGHNWSAPHCTCPSFTMNPSLTCANNFSQTTINTIIAFRNTRTCLTDCFEPLPNETCANAIPLTNGSHAYDNLGATTDGPDEPGLCDFVGETQVNSDVWFSYTADCDGEATFALCESSYPTKLAIYADSCPSGSGEVIACDLASCNGNSLSSITIPVTAGSLYYIRVGGRFGAQGQGLLNISCTIPAEPCPTDLNDDGFTNVFDLLLLLGEWGDCPGCVSDLNGDDLVNVFDMLELLSSWGACE